MVILVVKCHFYKQTDSITFVTKIAFTMFIFTLERKLTLPIFLLTKVTNENVAFRILPPTVGFTEINLRHQLIVVVKIGIITMPLFH